MVKRREMTQSMRKSAESLGQLAAIATPTKGSADSARKSVEDNLQTVEKLLADCSLSSKDAAFAAPFLSIVIPVYNELATVSQVVRVVAKLNIDKEIIVVDDASTDGTIEVLASLQNEFSNLKVLLQPINRGKGAALQAGFSHCRGEVVIIQDADLEYDPKEILNVVAPFQIDKTCDVVYGSRYLDHRLHNDQSRIHRLGNRMLTGLSNLCTGQKLTDMETCYKAFRRDVLQSIKIEQNRFGFEPEITAKLSAKKIKIHEVAISYSPRSYEEGKKIGWKDLCNALYCIVRYRFINTKLH